MRAVVCVPYRPGDQWRERNWEYVQDWWLSLDWPVYVGTGPEGPMNRSAARNQAAAKAGDWDVAIFGDADTIGQPDQIGAAVEVAADGVLSYPFDRFEGLSRDQTDILLSGRNPGTGRFTVRYPSPGGILAVGRSLFEEVGGWDEEFVGWGYEDLAFACAARTLGGVHREKGRIIHLWHPKAPEKRAAIKGAGGNRRRRDLYKAADGDPEAMRLLLAELGEAT